MHEPTTSSVGPTRDVRDAGGDEIALVPDSVGRVSRGWDEQHVDLRVAAAQIAHAPTAGFTPPVARAAADFLRAWAEHAGAAAELSEHQADDLRAVLAAWLSTDAAAGARLLAVLGHLEGPR